MSANCVFLGNLQGREKGRGTRADEDCFSQGDSNRYLDGREGAAGEPFVHSVSPAVLGPGVSDSRHHLQHGLPTQTDSFLSPNFRRRSWAPCFLPVFRVSGCVWGVRRLDCFLETSPAPRLPSEPSRPRAV